MVIKDLHLSSNIHVLPSLYFILLLQVSSVAERRSLTNIQCSQVSQANNTLEVVPDPVRKVTAHAPNGNVGSTGKIAASFSQYACHNGGNMQYAQPQIAKPSGLRMPSPSLGFFGQVCSLKQHRINYIIRCVQQK